MVKTIYHVYTNNAIVIEDEDTVDNWPDYTDVEPDIKSVIDVEQAAKAFREIRDRYLAATDWAFTSGQEYTEEALAYRQWMRDVPQYKDFPYSLPTPPPVPEQLKKKPV